jgi:hypothetical protein
MADCQNSPHREDMSISTDYLDRHTQFAKAQSEFSHHAAKAKCTRHGDLLRIGYSGPITLDSMYVLQGMVLPSRRGVSAVIERMDTAMILLSVPKVITRTENYPRWLPPSAIIVPAHQQKQANEYFSLLAKMGVLRVAFRPDQLDLANEWVDCYRAKGQT